MKPSRHPSLRDPQRVCTMYLVRHGQSEASRSEILGVPDSPLTARGRSQVRQVAKVFQSLPVAAVFCSDFLRARQTAEMLARQHHVPTQIAPALRERSFGRLEGAATPKARAKLHRLRAAYEQLSKEDRLQVRLVEDMETDEEAMNRLLPFLKQIGTTYRGQTVICTGHAVLFKILLVHLGFAASFQLPSGSFAHAGYVKLLADGEVFEVAETNGIHLNTAQEYPAPGRTPRPKSFQTV